MNNRAPGQEVRTFSDADFPHWKGWRIFDDDLTATDSRCDSDGIKTLLDIDGDHHVTPAERVARMSDETVRTKMRTAICAMPSEWDASTLQARRGWLQTQTGENPEPLDQVEHGQHSFDRFLNAHLQYCFNRVELFNATYRFHPKAFIEWFRRCGWLSEIEMLRCIPMRYRTNQGNINTPAISATLHTADARIRLQNRGRRAMFSIFRKYSIFHQRLAHFLSQVYQETGVLRWAQELASGAEYEGRTDLGNTHQGDGVRFKGRGLIQTTGRTNYRNLSTYHGKTGQHSFVVEPNNFLLTDNQYYSADAAGLYWVSRDTGNLQINISRVADEGVGDVQIRQVTRNVNGAEDALWTGLVARTSHTHVTTDVLLDSTAALTNEEVRRDV